MVTAGVGAAANGRSIGGRRTYRHTLANPWVGYRIRFGMIARGYFAQPIRHLLYRWCWGRTRLWFGTGYNYSLGQIRPAGKGAGFVGMYIPMQLNR
jgi:hypothetical protein